MISYKNNSNKEQQACEAHLLSAHSCLLLNKCPPDCTMYGIIEAVITRSCTVAISNYNRANDVAVCVETDSKTADVTVTKIAGYVRVCILMNL